MRRCSAGGGGVERGRTIGYFSQDKNDLPMHGTVFDASARHGGQPVQLNVGSIIPCWTEGLQLMKVGGKARLVCPSNLAYQDRGSPPVIMPGGNERAR